MTEQFSYGDIIRGTKRERNEAFHPIIYFGEFDGLFFEGGMLTHAVGFENIRLLDIHFNGKVGNDNRPSYFVSNALLKKQEWGPFRKIGELSELGIEIIWNHLNGTEAQIWEEYINE